MKARIGEILRHWRAIRGVSQRELAERAGVSTRHLAFVESGKAHPSRDAVLWLARALKVPSSEEAAFFEAAGYIADEAEAGALEDGVRRDVDAMLAGIAPHPALVHDVRGTIVALNRPMTELMGRFVGDVGAFVGVPSGGHQLVAALRPHLVDGRSLEEHYLRRVRDALLRGHGTPSPALVALFETLATQDAQAANDEGALDRRRSHPLTVRVEAKHDGATLCYDVLTVTLGTPMAMSLRKLRLAILLQASR